jgi:uncharacterized Zn finger protein
MENAQNLKGGINIKKTKMKCGNCGSIDVVESLYDNPDIDWESYDAKPLSPKEREYTITCNECGHVTHFRK